MLLAEPKLSFTEYFLPLTENPSFIQISISTAFNFATYISERKHFYNY